MSTEVTIREARPCDICKYVGPPPRKVTQTAEYDAKTTEGPWANMCEFHYLQYRAYPDLGTGKGQRLILKES